MVNYREYLWNHLISLEPTDGVIARCFQTLNLDENELTKEITKRHHPLVILDELKKLDPNIKNSLFILSLHSTRKHNLELKDIDIINNKIKSEFKGSGLLIFSDTPLQSSHHFSQHVPSKTSNEYERKIARHIEKTIQEQPLGSNLNPKRKPFPQESINANGIHDIKIKLDTPFLLNVNIEGVKYEFFCNIKKGKKLVIFGQDALNRQVVKLPHFFRWTWLEDLEHSGIILNDPTLYLSEELNAGWFVGTQTRDYLEECSDIIKKILSISGTESPPLFFGASAGGFQSLALASFFRDAIAIADIPQVDLTEYHHKNEVKKLLQHSLKLHGSIPEELMYRVKVTERFKKNLNIPKIAYLHNINDKKHLPQLESFIQDWMTLTHEIDQSSVGDLNIKTYNRWHVSKGGHFPSPKESVLKLINSYLN